MLQKNLFLVPFLLGLTSCYYAGKEQSYYDKFTNERISSVNLGMIKTTKNLGWATQAVNVMHSYLNKEKPQS